jgi:acyl-CoA dehydrogenase
MPWDFQTELEFERKLQWMERFVREETWPIETVFDELDQEGLDRVYPPLPRRQGEVRTPAEHRYRQ